MLVHGEFEQNDMVEYFGQNVRLPLLKTVGYNHTVCVGGETTNHLGVMSLVSAITVKWSSYAQSYG